MRASEEGKTVKMSDKQANKLSGPITRDGWDQAIAHTEKWINDLQLYIQTFKERKRIGERRPLRRNRRTTIHKVILDPDERDCIARLTKNFQESIIQLNIIYYARGHGLELLRKSFEYNVATGEVRTMK